MTISTLSYPTIQPSLTLDFAKAKQLDPRITFTRASSGTYVGSDGLLKTAITNEVRFDHNPTTGESLGLLVEEQRTNSIRNNTMVGAVAGTPGTLPTNWIGAGSEYGITREIAGTGVDNGIHYFDLRLSGTASSNYISVYSAEANNAISATQNDVWTSSVYTKLQSGSLSGVSSILLRLDEINSSSVFISGAAQTITPTSANLINQRTTVTKTFSNSSVAYAFSGIRIQIDSGSTVDFTLRIGMPQLELGAFPTSVIPTTNSAVTRAADVASNGGSSFGSWYQQDEGTFFAEVDSAMPSGAANTRILQTSDGTSANRQDLAFTSGTLLAFVNTANSAQVNAVTVNSAAANANARLAYAYKQDDFALTLDAGAIKDDTTGTLPTVDRLGIGQRLDAAGYLNGHIKRLTYWNRRLPNETLQTITQ